MGIRTILGAAVLVAVALLLSPGMVSMARPSSAPESVRLPPPPARGEAALEDLLRDRRSVREFTRAPLTSDQISRLLWSAQGVTSEEGERTAPSAGALYPLEVYLVAGNVQDLPTGVYHYDPGRHALEPGISGDLRKELAAAALDQSCVEDGAAVIVLAAVYERTTRKYGERGRRYVHVEAGHAAQNVCLEAVALGLGSVPVGAFDDERVRRSLGMPADHRPLYLLPVGKPR
jgi:SagB-type dehydrogenase family enzyme